MSMAFVSARLTELELKYMRLERTVEELSGVVAEQQTTIDRLLAQLAATTARVRDLGESAGPGDEKPPHY